MRLRALRKLEEIEIRKEFDGLTRGKERRSRRCSPPRRQAVADDRLGDQAGSASKFGPKTPLGRRRTDFRRRARTIDLADIHHAMIEKEPVTVVVSEKGWIRALKGHLAATSRR